MMRNPAFNQTKVTTDSLRQVLKLKHFETQRVFNEKFPLIQKFLRDKGIDPGKIRQHSAKIIGASILTGSLLLSQPSMQKTLPAPQEVLGEANTDGKNAQSKPSREILIDTFGQVLPDRTRPLSREEEKFLENIIQNLTKVPARATLEGEHLNTTYGRIGLEQHLRRFPGDTIGEHGSGSILRQGLAPGLGAWGYFEHSRGELSPEIAEVEKWYAVVQTLYLPDWNTRQPYLREWYKYRKVLIVNTKNGNAVVASIADSGPAAWTGKHFGGSPEVMDSLGGARYTKGAVILFFVDDPENKVPLGPVDYDNLSGSNLILAQKRY